MGYNTVRNSGRPSRRRAPEEKERRPRRGGAGTVTDMTMKEKVEQVLDTQVRPLLHSHGGEVTLLDCADGVVSVQLSGACAGCPSADLSTRDFIEEALRAELPELRRVELEHAVDARLLEEARRLLSRGRQE